MSSIVRSLLGPFTMLRSVTGDGGDSHRVARDRRDGPYSSPRKEVFPIASTGEAVRGRKRVPKVECSQLSAVSPGLGGLKIAIPREPRSCSSVIPSCIC
jgi:hypothetical protein